MTMLVVCVSFVVLQVPAEGCRMFVVVAKQILEKKVEREKRVVEERREVQKSCHLLALDCLPGADVVPTYAFS